MALHQQRKQNIMYHRNSIYANCDTWEQVTSRLTCCRKAFSFLFSFFCLCFCKKASCWKKRCFCASFPLSTPLSKTHWLSFLLLYFILNPLVIPSFTAQNVFCETSSPVFRLPGCTYNHQHAAADPAAPASVVPSAADKAAATSLSLLLLLRRWSARPRCPLRRPRLRQIKPRLLRGPPPHPGPRRHTAHQRAAVFAQRLQLLLPLWVWRGHRCKGDFGTFVFCSNRLKLPQCSWPDGNSRCSSARCIHSDLVLYWVAPPQLIQWMHLFEKSGNNNCVFSIFVSSYCSQHECLTTHWYNMDTSLISLFLHV